MMLHTLNRTHLTQIIRRAAVVLVFTLLTIVAARVRIEIGTAVPITLQTLAVMLAGFVLGARDGALSQVAYLGLIALNLPVDTRMSGALALAGPTAGFLVGFPVLAFVTGWLTERGADRVPLRWLAGGVGMIALYLFGAGWLRLASGLDWSAVWLNAVAPFIALDLLKALVAAGLAEGGRAVLGRLTP